MMADYEFIFSSAVRDELIGQVRGGVKTWIYKDTLYVSIRRDEIHMQWGISIDDMAYRITHGLSAKDVAWDVLKQYKQFILNEIVEKEFFK